MRKVLWGLIIFNFVVAVTAAYALSGSLKEREYEKFVEDSSGNVAVRIKFTN